MLRLFRNRINSMNKPVRFFSFSAPGIFLITLTLLVGQVFPLSAEIITPLSSQVETEGQNGNFRVMSFNIRYGTADDRENAWSNRKELVFNIISEYQPDLIGVQEALDFQLEEIIDNLPEYDYVGVGRDDGVTKGEFSAILYLKSRYRVISHKTVWLSDTPEMPGSKSWGNNIPRIITWAKLEDTLENRKLYMFNTHFDHQSQNSREKSAQMLVETVHSREEQDIPAVITGDFNAGEYNPVIRYLVEDQPITMENGDSPVNPKPFKDTFRTCHPEAVKVGTFNKFDGYSVGEKIDYVFSSGELQIIGAMIIRDNEQGRYPSDHFPVIANFSF